MAAPVEQLAWQSPCTYSSSGGSAVSAAAAAGIQSLSPRRQHRAVRRHRPTRQRAACQALASVLIAGSLSQGLRRCRRPTCSPAAAWRPAKHLLQASRKPPAGGARRRGRRPGVSSSLNQAANSSASSTTAEVQQIACRAPGNQGCVKAVTGAHRLLHLTGSARRHALENAEDEQHAVSARRADCIELPCRARPSMSLGRDRPARHSASTWPRSTPSRCRG